MIITHQVGSLQASGASTSDWIGQVKNRVIYAYDLSTLVSENAKITESTKVNRKSNMPFGEHIREAIRTIKGHED